MSVLRVATAVLVGLLVLLEPASAQSFTAENGATVTVEKGLDVTGDLSESGGGTLTFAAGAALRLTGSSQQAVGAGPLSMADLELDNANGAALNSAVDVTGTLTLTDGGLTTNGNLTLTSTGESASARISGSGSGTLSGDVTAERFVERKDGGAETSHWRMMASPLGSALDEENGGGGGEHDTYSGAPLLSNTWTQGDGTTGANHQGSGASPSVFFYDEAASVGTDPSQGWDAVDDLTSPTGETGISAQEGFAVYLFRDRDFDGTDEGFPITLSVTGSVASTENDGSTVSLPVSCTDNDGGADAGSDGCTDGSDGWNLVANPFLSYVDWTSGSFTTAELEGNAYVYDADNAEYDQTDGTNGGDVFIAPFQAFFVKSNAADGSEGNAALLVDSGAKADPSSSGDREFKSTEDEPLVSLQLTGEDRAEETRVTFRADAAAGKDRRDGYQLTPLDGNYHLLASQIEGRTGTFDSQYRPLPSKDSLAVDLAVTTTSGGTYTIETDTLADLPADLQVKVLDTQIGETADLRAGESLDFTVGASSAAPSENTSPRELLAEGPVQKAAASGVIEDRFDLLVIPASAIPVDLASLDATAEGAEVTLSWQTASETNNAGFAVERRTGDKAWSQIGFREGAGTTSQPQTYRFTDSEIPFEAEQVTYRLRQEDLDGSTTLSDEATVELGPPSETKLHAPFPNPAQGRATLRFELAAAADVQIAVYDVLGRRVRTVTNGRVDAGRHQRRLQTGDLPAGTYFVRMRSDRQAQTRRLTVVR